MTALATTSMRAIHAGIEETLRARFGANVVHYGAYEPLGAPDPGVDLLTPALLIDLEAFDQDDSEHGNRARERIPARCTLAVHCVLSLLTSDLQVSLREMAADVLTVIRYREQALAHSARGNRWGLGPAADFPQHVEAMPAGFEPGLNGRDSWLVRWEQTFYLPNVLSGD